MKRIKQYESRLEEIIKEKLTQCSNEDPRRPLLEALFQEDLISWEVEDPPLGVISDFKSLEPRKYHQIIPTVKGIQLYTTLRWSTINWWQAVLTAFLTALGSTIIGRVIYDHWINPWIIKTFS